MNPDWDIETPQGLRNACVWMLWFLSRISEGGIWVVPRSKSVYKVYHRSQFLIRTSGESDEPSIEIVARAIGWFIVDISHLGFNRPEE